MTKQEKNDLFYKILFAVELALLPLTVVAHLMISDWVMGIFVGGVLVVRVWRELFKEKRNLTHEIISAIASSLTFLVVLCLYANLHYIKIYLAVLVIVFTILFNIFHLCLYKFRLNDTIEAVDFCFVMFEFLTLLAFSFISFYSQTADIGLFAMLLTAIASVGYKIYYSFRYLDAWGKIKSIFRKK